MLTLLRIVNKYSIILHFRHFTSYKLQKHHLRGCGTRPREKIQSFLLTKYLNYIKSYDVVLEKRFPAAVKLYRVFSIGIKEFKEDFLFFLQVFKKVSISGQSQLSHRELYIYYRMPKDMVRVAPVLIMTALPFGGVIFPLAYMFPRTFLSPHFWSLQQRSEFSMMEHKDKLTHYRPVFRGLQAQLRSIKGSPLHKSWSKVLGKLGSGVHPTSCEIIECGNLFMEKPYHLSALSTLHVSHLLRIHGMHRGWWRKFRLAERARLLRRMDEALKRQGGPSSLSPDEIRWACFFRGFNPVNVSHLDTLAWLNDWLEISGNVDEKNLSLLLHTPVLIGYNQPSNWLLLHG